MIYIAILLLLAMPVKAVELTYIERLDDPHQATLVGPHLALAFILPITDANSPKGYWCWYMVDWNSGIKAMISAVPHKGVDTSEKPQAVIDFLASVYEELEKDGGIEKKAASCQRK